MENETTQLSKTAGKMTPLMQQYWDVKSVHPDKIILFRMGDFFEMFHRDAEIAAPILGIALTSRNKKAQDETPMCGAPHHQVGSLVNKILAAGHKVAICDQLEDPKFAKGLVKRGVTRILSPGVVYDPSTLDQMSANYLVSFDQKTIAFLETSTGEAFYFQVSQSKERERLFEILRPVELVVPSRLLEGLLAENQKSRLVPSAETNREEGDITLAGVKMVLTVHDLGEHEKNPQEPEPCQLLKSYARYMQGEKIEQVLREFERRELLGRLELGPNVLRHLEVFSTYKGELQGSLFYAINRTKTSAGARLLKNWLSFPLSQKEAIEARSARVETWLAQVSKLKELRSQLGAMGDIERRMGKIANPSCNPRDLLALAESLQSGLEASLEAASLNEALPLALKTTAEEISSRVFATLVDEPPLQTKNGHMIRAGVSERLDELTELSTNSQKLILDLEARERELTQINSLKVRFNNVFGYYIEITHTHKDKVPKDRYERKQTLANAERYLTPELAELEQKVLTAQSRRIELELEIFQELREFILSRAQACLQLSQIWSELDVITSFAWMAFEQNFVRPQFSDDGSLLIKGSRHPVVEQALKVPFVANDILIQNNECLLLTGPNMAGKSTLMRQVAVCSIMAQMGSFVPAQSACLKIFDRIFTRIGASDFLAEGLSTFMVEMKETAEMLKAATPHSLVILDEVGRGTSTFDGMSLAQAILEFLLKETRAMTLFATHYHELTELSEKFSNLKNAHMEIKEQNGQISFLHRLRAGPAQKSYGIHVAKLAGLPGAVTKRAAEILKRLETRALTTPPPQLDLFALPMESETDDVVRLESEPFVFDPAVPGLENGFVFGGARPTGENQSDGPLQSGVTENDLHILAELRSIEVNSLTPLEALNQLAKWRQNLS